MISKVKKNQNTKDYLLRNIPIDLYKEIQHMAIDEGVSLRKLILQALKTYVQSLK